ncbi:MAG: hypothetical protein RRY40_01790 [Oscillospiraceae bacterium]
MDAISKIAKAEQEAGKIISDANAAAKSLVAESKDIAQRDFDEIAKAAALKSSELCDSARREAKEQSKKFMNSVESECADLKTVTRDRIDGAVAIVVEKVVNG